MIRLFFLVLTCMAFTGQAVAKDGPLERIRKSQEINCGVYVLGSIFSYDKEGNPDGFTTDLMKEVGLRAGFKVKYSEISSFATIFEDLNTGHYDMICAPLLFIPATAMRALPGAFIMDDPINIYADGGADVSAIKSLDQLNNEKYTFVGMDNELGGIYVPKLFPKAKLNLLPLGTPVSNMMMDVNTKKADFVIFSRLAHRAFEQANPGKLKQVTDKSIVDASVRLFYPEGADALKANIDAVVEDMTRDGTLDKLLKKHGLKK